MSRTDAFDAVDRSGSLPFGREPRIGILVVAYNAASTLAKTLDRIPPEFRHRIDEVFVCDDASPDRTYLVGLGYQQTQHDLPISVIRHEQNLGYGGNQKAGYQLAREHDLDIIVLLHADGQYAPEFLPTMVEPLERGQADAVFGSRMMEKGAARRGGMPAYKFLGNKILTKIENCAARLGHCPSSTPATGPTTCTLSPSSTSPRRRTASTSTPRSSSRCTATARGSSRCRSRPSTATRSATSTA